MLEIPGEEAPTDPGIQARQRKEEEEKAARAKAQKKNRMMGALGALVLLVLIGAGGWAYQTQQEALTFEMEEYYATPLSELQQAAEPVAASLTEPGSNATASVQRPKRPTGTNGNPGTIGTGNPNAEPGGLARPPQTGGGVQGPSVGSAESAGGVGGVGAGAIKVGFVQTDKVLTDSDEIFAMIRAVINASGPQLQGCYNQRLKQVEGLKGAWEVSFTVAREGTAKSVRVSGVNGSDGELEGCMTRAVSTWKFQKIGKDQPVKRTYRFGASSW